MNSLKVFFKWIFAGIVSSILLAIIFVGIKTVLQARAEGFWSSQSKMAKLKQEIEESKQKQEQLTRQNKELKESKKSWWKPLEKLKQKENYLENELRIYKEKLDQAGKTADLIACNYTLGDYAGKVFKAYFALYLIYALFLVFLGPVVWKIFIYYVVAVFVENRKPAKALEHESYCPAIQSFSADVSLDFPLSGDQKLYLRPGDWGKKRTDLEAKTKFIWNIRYPLVSIVSNLVELIELSALPGRSGSVTITSPDPDMYIGRIDLCGNAGIVVRPGYLVAVTDSIKVRTVWNFNIHNIISGRVRQIILYGSGTVFITGCWGIDQQRYVPGQDPKIEDNLILGYEAVAEYSLCRTETFWHYLRGIATIFDLRIQKGTFLTQNSVPKPRGNETVFEKILGTVLNGIGTFLGF